jgi:hypothetical protein
MCFNEPVSWASFLVGTIFNLLLITLAISYDSLHLIALSLALQFVIFIQFFEAMVWRGNEKFGTYGVLLFTLLQPLIFGMLLLYPENAWWKKLFIGVILVFYIAYIILSLNERSGYDKLERATCTDGSNHLVYNFWYEFPMGSIPYLITALLIILILLPSPINYITAFILAITYGTSMLVYPCAPASIWCLFAVSTPIILWIMLYIWPSFTLGRDTISEISSADREE